jgi:hypothetical protein
MIFLTRSLYLFALLPAYLVGGFAYCDEPARVPYASLYHALAPAVIIAGFDRLIARQRIVSRRSDVTPAQIEIQILAASGVVKLRARPDGSIDFPMSQALLKENPPVESNQPKGSLSLSATMEIKLLPGKDFAYADVYASAVQAQKALAQLGPGMAGRTVRAIEFEFDAKLGASAELTDQTAEEMLIADDTGLLIVRIDPRLLDRNARLKFSHVPRAARPHID